jgi:hypothetical protein
MQNVCAGISSIDEPLQAIDLADLGVLEPRAHIRQVELAPGFAGKA